MLVRVKLSILCFESPNRTKRHKPLVPSSSPPLPAACDASGFQVGKKGQPAQGRRGQRIRGLAAILGIRSLVPSFLNTLRATSLCSSEAGTGRVTGDLMDPQIRTVARGCTYSSEKKHKRLLPGMTAQIPVSQLLAWEAVTGELPEPRSLRLTCTT